MRAAAAGLQHTVWHAPHDTPHGTPRAAAIGDAPSNKERFLQAMLPATKKDCRRCSHLRIGSDRVFVRKSTPPPARRPRRGWPANAPPHPVRPPPTTRLADGCHAAALRKCVNRVGGDGTGPATAVRIRPGLSPPTSAAALPGATLVTCTTADRISLSKARLIWHAGGAAAATGCKGRVSGATRGRNGAPE